MDQKGALEVVKKYVKRVHKKYPIEEAILFGSFASGKPHKDSDIDLAIVFENIEDVLDRQIELMIMRQDDELLIEPHPFSKSELHGSLQKNVQNPVISEIIETGIPIVNRKVFISR